MKKQRLKGKHKTRTIISVTAAVILLLPKGYLVKGETYEYDALNRIQKVYYDDGSVAEYFYDASGNIQNVRIETAQSQPGESKKTEESTKTEETTKIEQTKEMEETAGTEEIAQEALALGETVEGEEQKNLNKTKEKNIFQKIGEWFENIFHSLKEISGAVH